MATLSLLLLLLYKSNYILEDVGLPRTEPKWIVSASHVTDTLRSY